jgi:hypothetical protein
MWLGHDLVWWGFVISVVALALATIGIPVAIIAPIIAPKLENWWAERSVSSLRKRITALEKQLSDYERAGAPLSEAEDWILKGIEAIGVTVGFAIADLGCILSLTRDQKSIFNDPHGLIVPPTNMIIFITFASLLLALLMLAFVFRPIGSFRRKRSPAVRKSLRKSIEQLNKKLPTT